MISSLAADPPTFPGLTRANQTAAAQAGDQAVDTRGGGADAGVLAGAWRLREATILSMLAYTGLRPGEVFALSWDCVGERTLIVEHGRADGSLKATKTDRIRTVSLLAPFASDLALWRAATSAVGSAALVFPRTDGDVFRDTDYRNWRSRHFDPAALAAGADGATPYTLRHSFASLLVQAGWNALEISSEMGNSPEVVQRDYSHLFREFARGRRIDPEETIVAARRAVASRRPDAVSDGERPA